MQKDTRKNSVKSVGYLPMANLAFLNSFLPRCIMIQAEQLLNAKRRRFLNGREVLTLYLLPPQLSFYKGGTR